MSLATNAYRKAVNNHKCIFCGYRTIRVLRNGTGVEVSRIRQCMLSGEIIEDDHTCKFWFYELNEQIIDDKTSGKIGLGDPLVRTDGAVLVKEVG